MRLVRDRKGQFIIIAAMLLSIMIVSVSSVIYGTVTYYRQERWEEYVTIVDSIKASSHNLLRIGLANYTQTLNPNVTRDYFNRWIRDVRSAYPGFGVGVDCALANGPHSAYGISIDYNLGLNSSWGQPISYSASNATVSVNVASVGLTGYNFSAHVFLKMSILGATYDSTNKNVVIHVAVDKEGLQPDINLKTSNFGVKFGTTTQSFTLRRYFSQPPPAGYNRFIYEINVTSVASKPSSIEVTLQDNRGIRTVSYTTNIV